MWKAEEKIVLLVANDANDVFLKISFSKGAKVPRKKLYVCSDMEFGRISVRRVGNSYETDSDVLSHIVLWLKKNIGKDTCNIEEAIQRRENQLKMWEGTPYMQNEYVLLYGKMNKAYIKQENDLYYIQFENADVAFPINILSVTSISNHE